MTARWFRVVAVACLGAATLGAEVRAQGAAEPWEAGCLVQGLDPDGDGFLSVRTGPGSQYREIARVTNGDALFIDTRKCRGNWCFAEGASIDERRTTLTGWFYTAWCMMYP